MAGNGVPNSSNIIEMLNNEIHMAAEMSKFLMKNTLTFIGGRIAFRLYLSFYTSIMRQLGLFWIKNTIFVPNVIIGNKLFKIITPCIVEFVDNTFIIINHLLLFGDFNFKKLKNTFKDTRSLLEDIILTFSLKNFKNVTIKDLLLGVIYSKVFLLFLKCSIPVFIEIRKVADKLTLIGKRWRILIRRGFRTSNMIIEKTVGLSKVVSFRQIFDFLIMYKPLDLTLKYANKIYTKLIDTIIPSLLKISSYKRFLIRRGIKNSKIIVTGIIDMIACGGGNVNIFRFFSKIKAAVKNGVMISINLMAGAVILKIIASGIVPSLEKINFRPRKLKKKFLAIYQTINYIFGMFDPEYVLNDKKGDIESPAKSAQNLKLKDIIMCGLKMALATTAVAYISFLLTGIGAVSILAFMGMGFVYFLLVSFAVVFKTIQSIIGNSSVNKVVLKSLVTTIASLLTIIIIKKVIDHIQEIGNKLAKNDHQQLIVGIIALSSILITFTFLLKALELISSIKVGKFERIKLILDNITQLFVLVISNKIIDYITEIGSKMGNNHKQLILGVLTLAGVMVSMTILLKALQLLSDLNFKESNFKRIKVILDNITELFMAWAASKIADIAIKISQNAKEVAKGIGMFAFIMVSVSLLLKVIEFITTKLKLKGQQLRHVRVILDTITELFMAWAASKIADIAIEMSAHPKEIIIGMLILSFVLIMMAGVFALIGLFKKQVKKGAGAIFIMSLVSFSILFMFAMLAIAKLLGPIALEGMIYVGIIAIIFALIGLLWKYVIKGAVAVAVAGLALELASVGFIMFAIASIILSQGNNLIIGLIFLAAVCIIFGVVGMFFEYVMLGAVAMAAIGVALILLVTPLLIFAVAMDMISKIKAPEDCLRNIMKALGGGIDEVSNNENFNVGNLFKCVLKMGLLVPIVMSIGIMAVILQFIASLKIPTEYNEKGKPIAFRPMTTNDFVNAASNANAIASIFIAMFSKNPPEIVVNGQKIHVNPIDLDALDNIGLKVKVKFRQLRKIVDNIGKMAETLQFIASLKIPTEYNENGDPIDFRNMTTKDFMDAAQNANAIACFFIAMFSGKLTILKVNGSVVPVIPVNLDAIDNIGLRVKIKFRQLAKIVGFIGDMAGTLQQLSSLKIPVEFNENGNPTDFIKMKTKDFIEAAQNANLIAYMFIAMFSTGMHTMCNGTPIDILPINLDSVDQISELVLLKFFNLNAIVSCIGNMAGTLQKISSLSMPTDFDKDGKGKNFVKMEKDDFIKAGLNVATIASLFTCTFSGKPWVIRLGSEIVQGPVVDLDKIDNMGIFAIRKFKKILGLSEGIGKLASTIQQVAALNIPIEFDENGKGKKFIRMKNRHFRKVGVSILRIIKCMFEVISSKAVNDVIDNTSIIGVKIFKNYIDSMSGLQNIIDIVTKLASGSFVLETDPKTGKAKRYGNITELISNSPTITRNLTIILGVLPIAVQDSIAKWSEDNLKAMKKKFDYLKDMVDPMTKLIDATIKIGENTEKMKKVDNESYSTNIKNIILGIMQPITDESIFKTADITTIKQRFGTLDEGVDVIKKMVDADCGGDNNKKSVGNIKKATDATNNFLTKLQSIDTTKLDKMTKISDNMRQFAQSINGNFDALAKALSKELVEVLEKLDKTLQEANGKLDNVQKSVSGPPTLIGSIKGDGKAKKAAEPGGIKQSLQEIKNILQSGELVINRISSTVSTKERL